MFDESIPELINTLSGSADIHIRPYGFYIRFTSYTFIFWEEIAGYTSWILFYYSALRRPDFFCSRIEPVIESIKKFYVYIRNLPHAPKIMTGQKAQDLIIKACRNGRAVRITYIDYNGDTTIREIYPEQIFTNNNRLYVNAYCRMRCAERQFLLSRVVSAEIVL